MKLACYIKKESLKGDSRVAKLLEDLRAAGCTVYMAAKPSDITPSTDALLSLGGDGTFLSAARIAVPAGLAVLGVNFGRLGFLSENDPDSVVKAIATGDWTVEERGMLEVVPNGFSVDWPYALNETSVYRAGGTMLGVDVRIGGHCLPTYWADGLLVATSSGSTAYSLSVGGPICLPDSKVLIVSPIAPHNLNVRPLIVPEESDVEISLRARTGNVLFGLDHEAYTIPAGSSLSVRSADVRLKRIRLKESNFINALRSRLLWGQDVRNSEEQI